MTSRPYGMLAWTEPEPGRRQSTEMGRFLYGSSFSPSGNQVLTPNTTSNPVAARSQFGFVVYDNEAFSNLGFNDGDSQFGDPSPRETSNADGEEKWLDTNALPVLINRYNGTLVRGE